MTKRYCYDICIIIHIKLLLLIAIYIYIRLMGFDSWWKLLNNVKLLKLYETPNDKISIKIRNILLSCIIKKHVQQLKRNVLSYLTEQLYTKNI